LSRLPTAIVRVFEPRGRAPACTTTPPETDVSIGRTQGERAMKKGKSQAKKPAADKPKAQKVKPPKQAKTAHRPKPQ
jgi:hypothetical protein